MTHTLQQTSQRKIHLLAFETLVGDAVPSTQVRIVYCFRHLVYTRINVTILFIVLEIEFVSLRTPQELEGRGILGIAILPEQLIII